MGALPEEASWVLSALAVGGQDREKRDFQILCLRSGLAYPNPIDKPNVTGRSDADAQIAGNRAKAGK